ncbi:MAG TPA: M20/M25/M40 family metallo-hydrolase, partial [Vicinamibacteria bacterium]|nr:M20/M25/M40 family metallo-hydrolase [Vicinamibacteria bacterium]
MVRVRVALALAALGLGLPGARAGGAAAPDPLAEVAGRIVAAARDDGEALAVLQHLSDRIGPRLSGSAGAAEAVRWTQQRFEQMGLRAWTEPVRVPHWVRGEERGALVAPMAQPLALTALGGSPPTPAGGLTAEVVEVTSLPELRALPEAAVKGRIVFFNHAMARAADYGTLSPLRGRGPAEASRRGAVGALVRSLGTLAARLPHTGSTTFAEDVTPIPAAALAAEDADLLHRLLAAGQPVRVSLTLTCRTLGEADSANVLAELRGRERPQEIVLIGAHLDSWDLGTGAIDDGAGVAMVMGALRLLKTMGLTPRRTVRGVLFMNEENGLRGGRAYAAAHAEELARHVAAMESDSGAGHPAGLSASVGPGGLERVRALAALTAAVSGTDVEEGG